ncbi:MAG: HAMP domain-containing sensor histidine kinase [Arcobacteraceae bacterium]|nr:HAMP domain-containing sensor histidine kinase [Arcobacteraceae bacterium]
MNSFLSKPLLEPLFRSDENLQRTIKETLHELNIPASTIQANVQMLERTIKDEKNIKRLQRIKQATNELLKLYNQMEYEIKKEIDKIDKQQFSLNEIIDHSIEKFDDIKKDIQIEKNLPEIVLYSDKNGFQKVIDNLLSNAIKYNSANGVVKIEFKNSILGVYNSGKAIDTKNIMMIFEQYYQEDSSKKGFGLGLNIVKEFCDKNAIEIKIDSNESGTTFFLNLINILK